MIASRSFDDIVHSATGNLPYPYQRRLAEEGLPEVLRAPTGSGKTVAAVLPWLYRRRFHPDDDVRADTPRRLVVVLPQRSLVEQTANAAQSWIRNLGLDRDLTLHVLMGGLDRKDQEWQLDPSAEAVFVGTQDMVMSRLLMRGYAESRASWPISFGLLHCDTQFVFDEVQLMGPALPTSRQIHGLRAVLGTAKPCRSMWMSATIDVNALATVDAPSVASVIELTDDDRAGALDKRLAATRVVRCLEVDSAKYVSELATALVRAHRPGKRTIAVLNTVRRATDVFDALTKIKEHPPTVLLHSRFRPADRASRFAEAIADPGEAGLIVVATQVLEAGVDVDSAVMVTEAAPWSSIVQRAGRCNRSGNEADATLFWVEPQGKDAAAPYEPDDVAVAAVALAELENAGVSSEQLQSRSVPEKPKLHSVLRKRDLLELFDTMPDLTGNDLDVSRWIRDDDSFSCAAAWREPSFDPSTPAPSRDELCPVTVSDLRDWIERDNKAWLFDQTAGEWRQARRGDVRPGVVLVLDAAAGGYDPLRGWWPASKTPVEPIAPNRPALPDAVVDDGETRASRKVTLLQHLNDVEQETTMLFGRFGSLPGIPDEACKAAELASRYHDLGKAHAVFVESLTKVGTSPDGGPWAKSDTKGRLRHSRPGFRHELVSALMVLEPSSGLLDGVAEPDLVAYLVAAHHGKVRMSARSLPVEVDDRIRGAEDRVLGVEKVDVTPEVVIPGGKKVPALSLHRDVLEIGSGPLGDSWQARACRIRDRFGPFRLAFLEAIVRVADWSASASYKEEA